MAEINMNDRKNIPKKEVEEVKEVKEVKEPEVKISEVKEPQLKVLGTLSTEQIQETAKKYGITKDEAKELLNEASETFIKRLLSELQEKEPEIKEPEIKEPEIKEPKETYVIKTLFSQ